MIGRRPTVLVALAGLALPIALSGCKARQLSNSIAVEESGTQSVAIQSPPAQTWQGSSANAYATPNTYSAPSGYYTERPAHAMGARDDYMDSYMDEQQYGIDVYNGILSNTQPTEPEMAPMFEETGNVRQVTHTFDGADFDPYVMPDGSRLVYASTQHRPTADIYVKSLHSNVVTQLTNDPAHDVMPAVSPDGSHVAFASNRGGNWDVYVMPLGGGNAMQLTLDKGQDLHPTWSPDGTELAFCRLGQVSGRWELWVVGLDNPNLSHFIGYGLFPEWCPAEGTGSAGADRILFQRSRKRGDRSFEIWTIDYKDGQAGTMTQIGADPEHALINPTWSPDGQRIAYAAVPKSSAWDSRDSKPESSSIHFVDIVGGGHVQLTSGNAVDLMPAWSSNNEMLFVSDRNGDENIWTIDLGPAITAATGPASIARSIRAARAEEQQGRPASDGSFVQVEAPTE